MCFTEGPTTIGQVSLQKPYDLIRDIPLELWSAAWSKGVKVPLTLIIQPVNAMGIPEGKADTFTGCSRVSFKKPEVTRGSADEAMLEMVLQPTRKL